MSRRVPRSRADRQFRWWLAKRSRVKLMLTVWALVPAAAFCLGGWGLKHSIYDLPRTYDTLEQRGVPTPARFGGCGRDSCRLRTAYGGLSRSWDYSQNHAQFDRLALGASVPVLVDPHRPTTAYTVVDVERRTNAGFGVLAGFTLIVTLLGVIGLPWSVMWSRGFLREWDAGAEPQTAAARPAGDPRVGELLTAVDALDDLVYGSPGMPFSDDVRVDRGELDEAIARVRASAVLAMPSALGSPPLRLVERLEAAARGAPALPFGLGVRVHEAAVLDLLGDMRTAARDAVTGARSAR